MAKRLTRDTVTQNGFWVSVVAGAAAALTVALGQPSLAGKRGRPSAAPLSQPAE